jgi:Flp pilus assembly protein TadD
LYDNPDRAIELFQQELRVNPNHIGAVLAIGAEYMRRNNAAEAMPYARKGIELAPSSYASHTLLGRALLDVGNTSEALKELELARQMEPDDPQPRIALASLYTKLGRKEDAARERREFLRIQANSKKPNEK